MEDKWSEAAVELEYCFPWIQAVSENLISFSFVLFLGLIAYQRFCVIQCQNHLCRTIVILFNSQLGIGNDANSTSKKVPKETDQFWHNYKPKRTPTHVLQKIQEFGKKPNKKSKHSTIFFDQSGALKIHGHFLHQEFAKLTCLCVTLPKYYKVKKN